MNQINHNLFGLVAAIVSIISFLPYLRSILKHQTKPSGPSWWTWTILTTVTVVSSWFSGAKWSVLFLPTWLCVNQLIVAILSAKFGDNNWDWINKICIAAAVLGILLWVLTGQPLIALAIAIAADLLASIPNLRHIWSNPKSENKLGWTLGWLAAVLEVFAVTSWTIAGSGWAIYFLLSMSVTLGLIWIR